MIESRVSSKNPFIQQAEKVRAAQKKSSISSASPSLAVTQARLNFLPDERALLSMIDHALNALSMGRIWDRGSIINLLV